MTNFMNGYLASTKLGSERREQQKEHLRRELRSHSPKDSVLGYSNRPLATPESTELGEFDYRNSVLVSFKQLGNFNGSHYSGFNDHRFTVGSGLSSEMRLALGQ